MDSETNRAASALCSRPQYSDRRIVERQLFFHPRIEGEGLCRVQMDAREIRMGGVQQAVGFFRNERRGYDQHGSLILPEPRTAQGL